MPRILDREALERRLAEKYGITPREMKKVVQSQFQLLEKTMRAKLHRPVRLKYFGLFRVHPTTSAKIRERESKQDQAEVPDP